MKSEMLHKIFFSVFCSLIVILVSGEAFSQVTFAKKILGNTLTDAITIPSSDGGYISSSAVPFGQTYGWVKKMNGLGQRVWENELYFENDEFDFHSMSQTTDGGYISVGGNLGIFGITIKFGPKGDIKWKKKWNSTDGSGFCFLGSIALNDGGFLAAGEGHSGSTRYIILVRFNSSGAATSTSKFTLPDVNLNLNDFVAAPDGGFFIAGYTDSHSVIVIRLDDGTGILWSQLYEIDNFFYPRIASTSDNGAILTGTDNWGEGGRLLLLRLKSDGQVEWKKRLTFDKKINFPRVMLASDGGHLITADYYGATTIKMFLLKTDLAGESVFAKTFPFAESSNSYFGSVTFSTPDGGFLFSGSGYQSCLESTCKYEYFFKLDSNGIFPGCKFRSVESSSDEFGDVNITTAQISLSSVSIAESTLEGTSTPSQRQVLSVCPKLNNRSE